MCGGRSACGGRAVDVQRAVGVRWMCSAHAATPMPAATPALAAAPAHTPYRYPPARPRSINHRAGRATLFHVWSIADLYGILTPFWPVGEMPTCDWFSVLISNAVTSLKTGSF